MFWDDLPDKRQSDFAITYAKATARIRRLSEPIRTRDPSRLGGGDSVYKAPRGGRQAVYNYSAYRTSSSTRYETDLAEERLAGILRGVEVGWGAKPK